MAFKGSNHCQWVTLCNGNAKTQSTSLNWRCLSLKCRLPVGSPEASVVVSLWLNFPHSPSHLPYPLHVISSVDLACDSPSRVFSGTPAGHVIFLPHNQCNCFSQRGEYRFSHALIVLNNSVVLVSSQSPMCPGVPG